MTLASKSTDLPRTVARVRMWKASGSSISGFSTKTIWTVASSGSGSFVVASAMAEVETGRKEGTSSTARERRASTERRDRNEDMVIVAGGSRLI